MEAKSEHPLANAILSASKEYSIPIQNVEDFEAVPGNGLTAKLNGKLVSGRK